MLDPNYKAPQLQLNRISPALPAIIISRMHNCSPQRHFDSSLKVTVSAGVLCSTFLGKTMTDPTASVPLFNIFFFGGGVHLTQLTRGSRRRSFCIADHHTHTGGSWNKFLGRLLGSLQKSANQVGMVRREQRLCWLRRCGFIPECLWVSEPGEPG